VPIDNAPGSVGGGSKRSEVIGLVVINLEVLVSNFQLVGVGEGPNNLARLASAGFLFAF